MYILKLIKKEKICFDVYKFRFKQPLFKKVIFKPGQFVVLALKIDGKNYKRSYSISSHPSEKDFFEITIKRVKEGVFSNYMIDKVELDFSLEVSEPYGDFILRDYEEKGFNFWAVGSGITPIYPLINELLHFRKYKGFINLIYSSPNSNEEIFSKEINDLENSFDNLKVIRFYSRTSNSLNSKRIDENDMNKIFDKYSNQNFTNYICGPHTYLKNLKNIMTKNNVSEDLINYESFSVLPPENKIKFSEITVFSNETQNKLKISSRKSILETLLDNDIVIDYDCFVGQCNKCKVKILDGNVQENINNKFVNKLCNDEVLSCMSYIDKSKIKIKV